MALSNEQFTEFKCVYFLYSHQVLEKDLGVFDSKIEDVKMKALSAMDKFMMLIGQIAQNNLESKKSMLAVYFFFPERIFLFSPACNRDANFPYIYGFP